MNGREITWVRRSRIDSDGWDGPDIPLGEGSERYLLRLSSNGRLLAEAEVGQPSYSITQTIWSQMPSGPVTVQVAQLSQSFGRGPFARREFNAQ